MSTSQSSPKGPYPETTAARNRFIKRVGRILNNVEAEFDVHISIERLQFEVHPQKKEDG